MGRCLGAVLGPLSCLPGGLGGTLHGPRACGCGAGPNNALLHVLYHRALLMLVDEWRTSKLCPYCHSRFEDHYGMLKSKPRAS